MTAGGAGERVEGRAGRDRAATARDPVAHGETGRGRTGRARVGYDATVLARWGHVAVRRGKVAGRPAVHAAHGSRGRPATGPGPAHDGASGPMARVSGPTARDSGRGMTAGEASHSTAGKRIRRTAAASTVVHRDPPVRGSSAAHRVASRVPSTAVRDDPALPLEDHGDPAIAGLPSTGTRIATGIGIAAGTATVARAVVHTVGPGRIRPAPAYRQPALPPPDALGPAEELVAGRRPVEEAFVARRPAIRLLVVPQRRAALEKLVLHATNLRIPIVEVEGGSLTALAGFDGHQGIALVVEPRQFASLDDILARATERGEPPFVLVLDSLEDPHNVGSLLRSAEAAGVHGVVFPIHRQAPLSPSAVKASAGAIEHLLLSPADDLPAALSDLHARGLRIAGADGGAPLSARQTDLRGPLAIVVGSEGQGLGPAVRRRCDVFMRIPMKGAVGSLNAAVAGSILLFEALSQREDVEALPPPATAAPQQPDPSTERSTDEDAPATETAKPAPKPRKPRAKKVAVDATPAPDAEASPPPSADTTATPEHDGDLLPGDAPPKAPTRRRARRAETPDA